MKIVIYLCLIMLIMFNLLFLFEMYMVNVKKWLLLEKEVEVFLVIKWKMFFEECFYCRISVEVIVGCVCEGKNCNLSVIYFNVSNI